MNAAIINALLIIAKAAKAYTDEYRQTGTIDDRGVVAVKEK